MGNTQNAFEGYVEQIRLILDGYSRMSREQRIEKFISTVGWSFDGQGVKMEPYKDETEIEIGVQIEDAGRGGESILFLRYDVCDTSDEFVIPMLKLKFDESPKVMIIDDEEYEHSMDDYYYGSGSGLAVGYEEVSQYLKDHLIDIEIADFEDYVKEFELDYDDDSEYDEDDDDATDDDATDDDEDDKK